MSQTDKLISMTGLSRILNVIKEFVNNRISNTTKKIKHVDASVTLSDDKEIGNITLNPNEYMIIDNTWNMDELKISIPDSQSDNTLSYSSNDYACEFTLSNRDVKITLPSNVTKWRNGVIPSFKSSRTYVVSIVNDLGTISEYSPVTQTAVEGEE